MGSYISIMVWHKGYQTMNYEYASCEEMKEIKAKGPLSLDANYTMYLYMYTNLKSHICICMVYVYYF